MKERRRCLYMKSNAATRTNRDVTRHEEKNHVMQSCDIKKGMHEKINANMYLVDYELYRQQIPVSIKKDDDFFLKKSYIHHSGPFLSSLHIIHLFVAYLIDYKLYKQQILVSIEEDKENLEKMYLWPKRRIWHRLGLFLSSLSIIHLRVSIAHLVGYKLYI